MRIVELIVDVNVLNVARALARSGDVRGDSLSSDRLRNRGVFRGTPQSRISE